MGKIDDPKGDSEIGRGASATVSTGPRSQAVSSLISVGRATSYVSGDQHCQPSAPGRWDHHPGGPRPKSIKPKRISLKPYKSNGICPGRLSDLLVTLGWLVGLFSLFFWFSILKRECLSSAISPLYSENRWWRKVTRLKIAWSENSRPGPPHHSMQNKELSHPKKRKWTLRLITTSSQPVQPLADLQNSLP